MLSKSVPGMVISYGKEDQSEYVEIFITSYGKPRFSDPTMMIDDKALKSDCWEIKNEL